MEGREILELDLRMTDGSHQLIDLKDQSIKFSVRQPTETGLDAFNLILDYITQHQYKLDAYMDITGEFQKLRARRKWESEDEREGDVYDHEGFTRLFCNKVTYIMVVYKKEDSE